MISTITNYSIALLCVLNINLGFDVNKLVQKRMQKEITKIFSCKDFELQDVTSTPGFQFKNSTYLVQHQIFEIKKEGALLGYAFLGTAPSKTDTFEYLILFDENFIQKRRKFWFIAKIMVEKFRATDGFLNLKILLLLNGFFMEKTSVPFLVPLSRSNL